MGLERDAQRTNSWYSVFQHTERFESHYIDFHTVMLEQDLLLLANSYLFVRRNPSNGITVHSGSVVGP